MKQWETDGGEVLSGGASCLKDLVIRANAKQSVNQFVKDEFQAPKARNLKRTATQFVHGDSRNAFGGDAHVAGGTSGSYSRKVPQSAYRFENRDSAEGWPSTPARDQLNTKISTQKPKTQPTQLILRRKVMWITYPVQTTWI